MKKTLVAAILGVGLTSAVFAQGKIQLYNYAYSGGVPNAITYGANSGGTLGQNVSGASLINVGFYYVVGNQTTTVNAAMAGDGGNGSSASWGTTLGTGTGSTAVIGNAFVAGHAGEYGVADPNVFGTAGQFPGVTDVTVTLVVVAYNGANYESSTIRGHSAAFTVLAANINGTSFAPTTSAMPGFSIIGPAVPEPTTFALAGLGLAGLVIFRRRK